MARYKDVTDALTLALDTADSEEREALRVTIADYRARYDHGHYPPLLNAMFEAIEASVSISDEDAASR